MVKKNKGLVPRPRARQSDQALKVMLAELAIPLTAVERLEIELVGHLRTDVAAGANERQTLFRAQREGQAVPERFFVLRRARVLVFEDARQRSPRSRQDLGISGLLGNGQG